MFKQFRNWLANNRRWLFSRYTKDSQATQEPESTLIELPQEIRNKLIDRIEALASNPDEQSAIADKLDEAFELWRANPENANNSIIILSSPVTAVSRILTETLENWAAQKQISLRPLPLKARPDRIDTIKSKLKYYLEKEFTETVGTDRSEVLVIPNLNWCFLRSLEGLDGIEYLQSRLYDGFKDRFWIIGAGQVAWEYLNSVSSIKAYCSEVFTLPTLSSEQLQEWFDPIVNDLEIAFDNPRIDQKILDGDQDNKTNYFDRLADISDGSSIIAVQSFLKSLGYQEVEQEETLPDYIQEYEPQKLSKKVIIAQIPQLPELPALEQTDRYLLYSLLLHGDLTISALAESLGDPQAEVQARVQVLRHQGVVQQKEKIIKINPIHYPNIKKELTSNNFAIN
ncbi:MAG: winged helix-turn-helix domain-containing protein [Pleurocapsa sp.]